MYFYFAMNYKGLKDPVKAYLEIEEEARLEILRLGIYLYNILYVIIILFWMVVNIIEIGGSISHHHGVGKLRAQFLPQCITPTHARVLKAIKTEIDPKNIFAARSIIIIYNF